MLDSGPVGKGFREKIVARRGLVSGLRSPRESETEELGDGVHNVQGLVGRNSWEARGVSPARSARGRPDAGGGWVADMVPAQGRPPESQ